MRIRGEITSDRDAIRALHICSFPTSDEADLVERLREEGDAIISLVAEVAGCLAGHALFSRMTAPFPALGLAPVAVFPEWRRQGMAARLIETGLAAARADWDAVFVLGEPAYYGRFGFDVTAARGFQSRYAGPYFMVRALKPRLPGVRGPVDYPKAFAALG